MEYKMNRKELLKQFNLLKQVNKYIEQLTINLHRDFPHKECVHLDEREDNIYNGENWYCCMMINRRDLESVEFKMLKPYVYKAGTERGYAWVDKWNNYYDNVHKPVHGDNENEYVYGYMDCTN